MRTSTVYRLTVPKFHRLAATGVFEDDRVELLDGVLTLMTTGPAHDYAVSQLGDLLSDLLSNRQPEVQRQEVRQAGHR